MTNIFYPWFKIDALSGFIALAIAGFFALILVYSFKFIKGKPQTFQYYVYIILTALVAIGAVLANNLILLLVCWGFLGLTLYLLIIMGDNDAGSAAKKTFIIVGGTDALMLFGIGIIYYMTGTFQMDQIKISLSTNYYLLPTLAYLCLAIACFAKAGAMPFHSWIPDCAKSAPLPAVAFLPASLDKLLGIYLLTRVSLHLFTMNQALNIFLMITGAFTIIAGVMMAMVQHNMKRLLGYHAVSQVGYMVLGIGTGNPIGIAGGIFHMLNNTVYKSCLFLTAGNVEYRAKTSELDELGGLGKSMPITYISSLIASLSISGVPPFNGFVSKWMIYQGLVSLLGSGNQGLRIIAIFSLAAAMFGSGLTLASFMKLIHAVFLGRKTNRQVKEVSWQMWLPCLILAIICVVFGVLAYQIPLKYFIFPAIKGVSFIGTWSALLSTWLVIISLVLGFLIFKLRGLRFVLRQDSSFTGSETRDIQENKISGTDFYNTIQELPVLAYVYKKAQAGLFDIYEQGKILVFSIGSALQYLHNGVLPTYLVWTLLGMIGLFWALLK